MTNILEFKKKPAIGEITIQVETQRMDDGSLWMRVFDIKKGTWEEQFKVELS